MTVEDRRNYQYFTEPGGVPVFNSKNGDYGKV